MTEANSNWEEYFSTLKRMPKRLKKTAQFVVDVVPDLKCHKIKKVLDLGCGAGRHCVLLADSGFEVVGLDVSRSALRMAKQWVRKEKLGNAELVRATMTSIPFEDDSFGAVVSVSVMHHAFKKDIVMAVNEIFRVLSKDGWFAANMASVTDPRFGQGKMLEDNTFSIVEAFEERRFRELHHFFTKHELIRLLRNFCRKEVTKMNDKPNYWNVLAVK